MFVRNLEAKLSGNTDAIQGEAPGLDAASLVLDVLKGRLKRLFGRLFGSR